MLSVRRLVRQLPRLVSSKHQGNLLSAPNQRECMKCNVTDCTPAVVPPSIRNPFAVLPWASISPAISTNSRQKNSLSCAALRSYHQGPPQGQFGSQILGNRVSSSLYAFTMSRGGLGGSTSNARRGKLKKILHRLDGAGKIWPNGPCNW